MSGQFSCLFHSPKPSGPEERQEHWRDRLRHCRTFRAPRRVHRWQEHRRLDRVGWENRQARPRRITFEELEGEGVLRRPQRPRLEKEGKGPS